MTTSPVRDRRRWRPSLTRGVQVATASVLVLLVGAGLTVRTTVGDLDRARALQSETSAAQQAGTRLLTSYLDEETGLRGFLLTGRESFLQPYDRAQSRDRDLVATLRAGLDRAGVDPAPLEELTAAQEEWRTYAAQEIALRRDPVRGLEALSVEATGVGKRLFDVVRARATRLDAALVATWQTQATAAAALQHRLVRVLVAGLGLLLAVTVVAGLLLWLGVSRPLSRLAGASRAVASGDLTARMPRTGVPEVVDLAADVGAMRDRLTADLHGTHEAVAALEHAEPAVGALRRALTPTFDGLAGTDVHGRLDAAEGVLAGDWFDVLRLDEERLALIVGDVAGHGPVSAVFALRLKHSLATALRALPSPAAALDRVSVDLAESPDPADGAGELFATVFIAVVDTGSGTLRYASAGHPDAFVLAGGRGQSEPPDVADLVDPREVLNACERRGVVGGGGPAAVTWTSLPSSGPLLSPLVAGWGWDDRERPFRTGEALLVYTDGIVEARDTDGVEFGAERVLATVAGIGLADGPRLLDAIAAGAVLHAGRRPRRDDQTLVLLRRTRSVVPALPPAGVNVVRPRAVTRP